jgi:hypothetical protein
MVQLTAQNCDRRFFSPLLGLEGFTVARCRSKTVLTQRTFTLQIVENVQGTLALSRCSVYEVISTATPSRAEPGDTSRRLPVHRQFI